MKRVLLRLAACIAAALVLPAQAQQQAPAPSAAAMRAYDVAGFRSARFGMSEADLRLAIANDFPAGTVTAVDHQAEGTRVLVLALPQLPPGPGDANVSYVLGARSGRLMHVNVGWASDAPGPGERQQFAVAALQLSRYFAGHAWSGVVRSRPAGDQETMIVFAGRDAKGSGVELTVSGADVAFGAAAPTGAARLQIAYRANVAQPDVARVRGARF